MIFLASPKLAEVQQVVQSTYQLDIRPQYPVLVSDRFQNGLAGFQQEISKFI